MAFNQAQIFNFRPTESKVPPTEESLFKVCALFLFFVAIGLTHRVFPFEYEYKLYDYVHQSFPVCLDRFFRTWASMQKRVSRNCRILWLSLDLETNRLHSETLSALPPWLPPGKTALSSKLWMFLCLPPTSRWLLGPLPSTTMVRKHRLAQPRGHSTFGIYGPQLFFIALFMFVGLLFTCSCLEPLSISSSLLGNAPP